MAEAVADLPLAEVEIETPMEGGFIGGRMARPTVLAAVLRAGVGMLDGALDLLGDSPGRIHRAAAGPRDHPPGGLLQQASPTLAGARTLVLEPMLASGGSLAAAVDVVKAEGGEDIAAVCVVTCPEGVATMAERHPDTPVFTAGHDRGLDPRSYILPGLGDMGDRLFGTPH